MVIKKITSIIFIVLFSTNIFSQTELFKWKNHISFNSCNYIAKSDNKIFIANSYGLFEYNISDSQYRILSKVNILSETGITSIACSSDSDLLLIGYSNGVIDIVNNNKTETINEIKNSIEISNKRINSFRISENTVWASTDFGIVNIDLSSFKIKDIYYIGDEGEKIKVSSLTNDGNKLFAATEKGVFELVGSNPSDFNSWSVINGTQNNIYKSSALFNGKLYSVKSDIITGDELWQITPTQLLINTGISKIKSLSSSKNTLAICGDSKISYISSNNSVVSELSDAQIPSPESIISGENESWICDNDNGFVKYSSGNFESLTPNGPKSNKISHVVYKKERFFMASPNYYSVYNYEKWVNTSLGNEYTITHITTDNKGEEAFISTLENGIISFDLNNNKETFNSSNSSLEIGNNGKTSVNGIFYDNKEQLWASNSGAINPVSMLATDGNWSKYQTNLLLNKNTGYIINTIPGIRWVVTDNSKLFAFEPGSSEKLCLVIDKENKISNSTINTILEDKNSALWIGTTNGVWVSYSPQVVRNGQNPLFSRESVVVKNNIIKEILQGENITDIEVDGGNRKWFATSGSGLYCYDSKNNELKSFNTSNSPIPSNNISDISINTLNGDIMIATDSGLITYRSQATNSKYGFGDVYAFPNPVEPDYDGVITITGLVDETNVKITTITGNLIFETTSKGGQAIWDGKTFSGDRPATGVYLAFCSTKDGKESIVTKILFIN